VPPGDSDEMLGDG